MKAWIVSDAHGEYGSEIVYAETSGRAKSLCMNDDTFDDCDFITLRFRVWLVCTANCDRMLG